MYIALSRVMNLSIPSTLVLNFTVSLPRILKVEFIPVDNPEISWFRGEYEIKKDLLAKQWSLAPKSIKIRIFHLLWKSVCSTSDLSPGSSLLLSIPIP